MSPLREGLGEEDVECLESAVNFISGVLPEEVIPEVITYYPIGEVLDFWPLGSGFFNKPIVIYTSKGKYVLREARVHNTPEAIAYESSLIDKLKSQGFPISEILTTREGSKYVKFKGRLYTVCQYIEGYELSWEEDISAQRIVNIAKTLARFHKITSNFIPEGNVEQSSIIQLEGLGERFRQLKEKISAIPPELRNDVESFLLKNYNVMIEQIKRLQQNLPLQVYQTLPKVVIHGDYARKNIRLRGDKVVGVFDWDRIRYDVRIYDIVWGMISFGGHITEPSSINSEKAIQFLKAYKEEADNLGIPLGEEEIKSIPEIYRAILIEFLSWTLKPYKQISMQKGSSLNFWRKIVSAMNAIDGVNWGEFFRKARILKN